MLQTLYIHHKMQTCMWEAEYYMYKLWCLFKIIDWSPDSAHSQDMLILGGLEWSALVVFHPWLYIREQREIRRQIAAGYNSLANEWRKSFSQVVLLYIFPFANICFLCWGFQGSFLQQRKQWMLCLAVNYNQIYFWCSIIWCRVT